MRILVAPTAFKGSYSPTEVAKAMSEGVTEFARFADRDIYIDLAPLADGGDGTVEAVAVATGASIQKLAVNGSLADSRTALWLKHTDYALVEMASACGIAGLEPSALRPLAANSRGLGAVVKRAVELTSSEDIVVGVGGSASTDGGSAALHELGAKFFDYSNQLIAPAGGGSLLSLARCDLSGVRTKLGSRRLRIATDVVNPLLGSNGAAAVFGPQKGASPDEIKLLEQALSHFADIVEAELGTSLRNTPGAGAAGGTGFGLAAVGGILTPGFDWIANALELSPRIAKCDLVITGEGRTDQSSLQGKVVGSLNRICRQYSKPLWIISGSVSDNIAGEEFAPDLLQGLAPAGQLATAALMKSTVFDLMSKHFKS